ncbi:MAG: hypothetical protein ACYDBQ_09225 [Thermoplasmatota archaeon]
MGVLVPITISGLLDRQLGSLYLLGIMTLLILFWALLGMVTVHTIRGAFIEDPTRVDRFLQSGPSLKAQPFLEGLKAMLTEETGQKRWRQLFGLEAVYQWFARRPFWSFLGVALVSVLLYVLGFWLNAVLFSKR